MRPTRPTRTFLVAAGVLLAALIPPAAGGAQALASPLAAAIPGPAAVEPGTIVQEGGPLRVPAGEEGPLTTRLTVTLSPGATGPLLPERLAFRGPDREEPGRPGLLFTSTCAVNGGPSKPCAWDSPDPEAGDGVWLVLDLPGAEVPAGSSTVTYDITLDVPSGSEWLGTLSTTVELDTAAGVVARGDLSFQLVTGTPEAYRRASLHARDRDGVLWQYDATGRNEPLLKARKRVGGGWNVYTALTKLGTTTASGFGDMVARDRDGVLWYYRGGGVKPFAPRVRVGGGWNVYTGLTGLPGGDLVARDRDGVLWRYPGPGTPQRPFGPRVRVGGGWNVYTSVVAFGDGLVARTADGRQWRYEKADGRNPAVPFEPRRPVGGGWNAFTALAGTGLVGGQDASLAARTKDGRLLMYGVLRWGERDENSEPYHPRPAGHGWNIYDLIV
ncbi:tachylectin-related carbohydrate-binding protein [Streptomyces zaomyceticus]|uniref:tachylectin-related carbohydrate-binding protein n=1 Tax=Streptomyces zaomyceticus TaxID=68286 RepID=UPI002E213D02